MKIRELKTVKPNGQPVTLFFSPVHPVTITQAVYLGPLKLEVRLMAHVQQRGCVFVFCDRHSLS